MPACKECKTEIPQEDIYPSGKCERCAMRELEFVDLALAMTDGEITPAQFHRRMRELYQEGE